MHEMQCWDTLAAISCIFVLLAFFAVVMGLCENCKLTRISVKILRELLGLTYS